MFPDELNLKCDSRDETITRMILLVCVFFSGSGEAEREEYSKSFYTGPTAVVSTFCAFGLEIPKCHSVKVDCSI